MLDGVVMDSDIVSKLKSKYPDIYKELVNVPVFVGIENGMLKWHKSDKKGNVNLHSIHPDHIDDLKECIEASQKYLMDNPIQKKLGSFEQTIENLK